MRTAAANGSPIRGAEVDDAARHVIVERGYGEFFTHRTGHSIDARDLHGSGPHLDNLETRDERLLVQVLATPVVISILPQVLKRVIIDDLIMREGVLLGVNLQSEDEILQATRDFA